MTSDIEHPRIFRIAGNEICLFQKEIELIEKTNKEMAEVLLKCEVEE